MRVLVTGAGGLVGGRLAAILHARGLHVLAAWREAPPPAGPEPIRLDLDDAESLARALDARRPDAVVHTAALSRVDRCHAEPARADALNAQLPGTVARLCRERALGLVALSTDLAFAGDRPFAREGDPVGPLSAYARSKLAGEQAVLEACPEAAIARIALVIGRGHGARGTASESIVWALSAGRPVTLFADEHRTPIDPESIAGAVAAMLERKACGVFHLGGRERLSRLELGRRVARAFGLSDAGLVAGSRRDHPAPEPRAADVSLDSTRARRELGFEARPLDEALREGRARPPA